MRRERAVKFWMDRESLDRKSALERWDLEVEQSKHRDQAGPAESRLRIPVKIEDFLVVEDSDIYEKEKLLEHKRTKHNEEQDMLMDDALESGRAATSSGIDRMGVSNLENTGLISATFGRKAVLSDTAAAFQAPHDGPGSQPDQKTPKKLAAFDVGLERIVLKDRPITALDKELGSLRGVMESTLATLQDPSFQAAFVDSAAPSHELQAMRMLQNRREVAECLIGSYTAGQTDIDQIAADQDSQRLLRCLQTTPAELPDIFKNADPLSSCVRQLAQELENITDAASKKSLEVEFRPVVNVVAIMKTSLKAGLDKYVKFGKARAANAAKQKEAEERKEVKALQQEKKKREAQEQRLSKAAEKQGRVGDIFSIDLVKLQAKCMDAIKFEDIQAVDWKKPFVARTDDVASAFPAVQALLADNTVTTSLQSFYMGFPGSQAALQGSRRFTCPVKMTQELRSKVLQELGVRDQLPEGLLSLPAETQ